jgi:tetratricopeptide (TPR) repeat protein
LSRAAGRNPFFLIELVNDYCERAGREDDCCPADHVPSSIRQLIANRLRDISKEGRTLLQLLSVSGSLRIDAPIPLEELPPHDLPDVADDLLRARLIDHESGEISIRHELIRQTAYDLMGPIKRAVLHRKVAESVLHRLEEAGHGEAAIHFDRAGDRAAAFRYAASAAAAAQANGAVPEAIRFWETAHRNAATPEDAASTTRRLAELLYDARRLDEAVPILEAAVLSSGSDEAPRYELMRLDAASELPGADQESCLTKVERIAREAAETEEWALYAEAVEVRLRMLDRLYRLDDINQQLRQVRALAKSADISSPYASCLVHTILALSAFYSDDEGGRRSAQQAVQLATDHHLPRLILKALQRDLICLALCGKLHTPEGDRSIERALRHAAMSGDVRSKATIYNTIGSYYLDIGNYAKAELFLSEATSQASGPSERALISANLGELRFVQGNVEEAARCFAFAAAEMDRQPVSGLILPLVLAGQGLCALERGQVGVAQAGELQVREALTTWVYDPYLLIRYLAELERRRGQAKEAVHLIQHRARLERHRPTYWIKIKVLEARYLRLLDPDRARQLWAQLERETEEQGLLQMLHV